MNTGMFLNVVKGMMVEHLAADTFINDVSDANLGDLFFDSATIFKATDEDTFL